MRYIYVKYSLAQNYGRGKLSLLYRYNIYLSISIFHIYMYLIVCDPDTALQLSQDPKLFLMSLFLGTMHWTRLGQQPLDLTVFVFVLLLVVFLLNIHSKIAI